MTEARDGEFETLLEFILESRGFDFRGYKRPSLQRRIGSRLEAVGLTSVAEYQDYLQVHPDEFTNLFNHVLINVTSFFRDPPVWDFIADQVIPRIVGRRGESEQIRVWCAGTASGEEAYSVAMLLGENLGQERLMQRVKIYATDIDEAALTQARQATYSQSEVEAIPPAMLERYFDSDGGRYTFDQDLRRAVIFGHHDLLHDAPISKLDLLLCRNTLMYFNAETQRQVIDRLHFALTPGGFLILGRAEMLFSHLRSFYPVELKHRVFARGGWSRDNLDSFRGPVRRGTTERRVQRIQGRDLAFDASPTAQMLVDRNGTLVLANQRAREMFRLSISDLERPLQDLEVSYRPVEIRSLIERARGEQQPVIVQGVPWTTPGGEVVILDVEITPLIDGDGDPVSVGITFTDVTRFRQLQDALTQTNQELETTMEELQSSNEELETTNEELQSTNEELQTTNEELQSTNEELETMNEELHSTNEELQSLNANLRERSAEGNELNAFLEGILSGVKVGVVVLDGDARVRLWNAQAENMWGLREEETAGRRLEELDIGLPVSELGDPIRAFLDGRADPAELTVKATNRRGRTIACRVTFSQYGDLTGNPQGVILIMDEATRGPG